MRTPPRVARIVALLVSVLVATACGVRAQGAPEAVTTAAAPAPATTDGSSTTGPRLTVYLVRGADLAPVERRTAATTTQAALAQLVEGPTRVEAGTGIRTALPPEVVGVQDVAPDGVATIEVTRGFTGITGGNQLLATAQLVWTLTDLPTVTGVRFVVEAAPVEVPTDAGLSDRPVDRDDYLSVAPADPVTPATTAEVGDTPSGTPTPR